MTPTIDPLRRRLAPLLLTIAAAATALAGCASTTAPAPAVNPDPTSSAPQTAVPTPSSPDGAAAPSATAAPATPEANPPGDIPDNQAYVAYRPPGAAWQVKVPEGWARSVSGTTITFTDKLNEVQITTTQTAAEPTAASATATVDDTESGRRGFAWGRVDTVKRAAGTAYRTVYRVDGPSDPVTGKAVNDDVETYTFWRNGRQAVLRLSGPHGADNVDPWKIITDSFRWQK